MLKINKLSKWVCAVVLMLTLGVGAVAIVSAQTTPPQDVPGATEIDLPQFLDFADISAENQSPDPTLYNFQFYTSREGLYCYFVQYVDEVVEHNFDPWKNTHVEMEIWQYDIGYGWDGTYVALFTDNTMSVNNLRGIRSYYNAVRRTQDGDKIKLEYVCWLEFDNNELNIDPPYAYIKQYQYIPNFDAATPINSQIVVRDPDSANPRSLITGAEKSYGVRGYDMEKDVE